MKRRRMYLLFISAVALFAFALTSLTAWAQAATPISGVKGKLQKVTAESLDIESPKGVEHVKIKQPLTTYGREPSDLSHVTSQSFVGVTSVKQADGKEQAKEIHIFPPELKGAGEGSNMIDQASQSRMTNGSVSSTGSRMTNGTVSSGGGSRMTNGTVQKQGGGQTIVVQYQDGSQTITVPPGTEVTQIVPKQQKLEAGDTIYAATEKGPDGTLTTNKVYVISAKSGSK